MSDELKPVDELFPTLKSWRDLHHRTGQSFPREKSKDMIVYMSPDEFLDMAIPIESMDDLRYFGPFTGEKSIDAIHEITRLMRGGTAMDDVPKLGIDARDGRVQNHNGRHRANALKKLGYEKMPVRIQSLSSGGGVRWSEQRDPSLFSYNEDLPTQLISEDGTKTMDAPWETEGPNRGLPRAEYATDQPHDLPRARLYTPPTDPSDAKLKNAVFRAKLRRQAAEEALQESFAKGALTPEGPIDWKWNPDFRGMRPTQQGRQVGHLRLKGFNMPEPIEGIPIEKAWYSELDYRLRGQGHGKEMYRQAIENLKRDHPGGFVFAPAHLPAGPTAGTEAKPAAMRVWRSLAKDFPSDPSGMLYVGPEDRMPSTFSTPTQLLEESIPIKGARADDDLIDMLLGKHRVLIEPPSTQLLEESIPSTGAKAMARIEIIPERMEILVFEQGNPAPQGRLQLASLEEAADPDWARSLREMFPDLPEGMAGQAVKDVQLAEHLRGQGLGSKMYDAATELLEQKYPGGVFFAPSGSGAGATTPEAERVWGSLKTRRPTNGTGVYIGPERLTPPSFAKPSTQLLEESIPPTGARAMADKKPPYQPGEPVQIPLSKRERQLAREGRWPPTPLQKKLSPSEQRYFAEVSGSWADAEDLADAGLSLSDDGKTLYIADEDKAFRYLDEVYISEMKPGGRGTSTLPRSFNDPDAFLQSTGARAMANQYPDYPYYVYDREAGGILSGWEYAEDAQDALDEIEELHPGRARSGSARAYKQKFGHIVDQSDWVVGSVSDYLERIAAGVGPATQWDRDQLDKRFDELERRAAMPPREDDVKLLEQSMSNTEIDRRLADVKAGVFDLDEPEHIFDIDELIIEREALSQHGAPLSNPDDMPRKKMTQAEFEAWSAEPESKWDRDQRNRKYMLLEDERRSARGMPDDDPRKTGMVRRARDGSWTPAPAIPYVSEAERTGMVRREDPRKTGMVRRATGSDRLDAQKIAAQMSEAQKEHIRKQSKRINEAIINLGKVEQTEGVVTKLAKLRAAAAKVVPVLVALGDAAFVAELGWNIYTEGSGGFAETGADAVEGMGMIAQAPAWLAGFVPGHEERQERGLLTPPEVAAEGLAAVGRGVEGTMGPYREMRGREDRRAHFERTKAFYRELEPTLSEDQIREMAMRDVSGESAQEAIDDLQSRVSDRDVMMDGFPAQSGMIAGNMGRSQEPRTQVEPFSQEAADRAYQGSEQQMMNRVAFARQEAKDEWARVNDILDQTAEGQVDPRRTEDFDRAYQGSKQQREDEARYMRGGK